MRGQREQRGPGPAFWDRIDDVPETGRASTWTAARAALRDATPAPFSPDLGLTGEPTSASNGTSEHSSAGQVPDRS